MSEPWFGLRHGNVSLADDADHVIATRDLSRVARAVSG
jgi:hypothetical protein